MTEPDPLVGPGGLIGLDDVRAALALDGFDPLEARRTMSPVPRVLRRPDSRLGAPHQASVIMLLYPGEHGLSLPLIRRAEHPGDVHSGQISLPGGSREPGETPVDTALREAGEELGVGAGIEILGELSPLYIAPSDFEVTPFVGWLPVRSRWLPDEREVVEVLECSLAWLFEAPRKHIEDWAFEGYSLRVPWYEVTGHRVWGATAILLGELEQRLRQTLNGRL